MIYDGRMHENLVTYQSLHLNDLFLTFNKTSDHSKAQ